MTNVLIGSEVVEKSHSILQGVLLGQLLNKVLNKGKEV